MSTSTTIVVLCSLAALSQQVVAAPSLANVPGGQTAGAALASATDGMSRYLAPNGPIQPAITAIGGLPMRGAELTNRGITSISSGLNRGAQSMSRAAGQNGQIRMPGVQTLGSYMPDSMVRLGQGLQSAIRSKNSFIAGQAEAGVASGDRLRNMMQQGLVVRASSPAEMIGNAQETLRRGAGQLRGHLEESLSGHRDPMQSMQGFGSQMGQQAQGLGRKLGEGLQGAAGQLQQTGEKMRNQLQSNSPQNRQPISGALDSIQGSIGNTGSNVRNNLESFSKQAQNAAQSMGSRLQQAAQGTLQTIQNMGSNLGNMLRGGSSGNSSGGRL